MNYKIAAYFIVCLFLVHPIKAGDDFCGIKNFAFNSGEEINYNLYYSLIGLYINAGSARFAVAQEKINETPSYHVTCIGASNSRYDWIFKVRDRYETYIDTATLKPYRFVRHVEEGGFRKDELVNFYHDDLKAVSTRGTYPINNCIQAVLSSIYYARNIDFSKKSSKKK